MFSFSHITFLSAEFRMQDDSLPDNSAKNICAKTAKDHTKITKKRVVNLRFLRKRQLFKCCHTLKTLIHPLKTLNKELGKEKIKAYLCTRYKK